MANGHGGARGVPVTKHKSLLMQPLITLSSIVQREPKKRLT
jgi:hypothetical protein